MSDYNLIKLSFNWLTTKMNLAMPYNEFVSICIGLAILALGIAVLVSAFPKLIYALKGIVIDDSNKKPIKFYETPIFAISISISIFLLVLIIGSKF